MKRYKIPILFVALVVVLFAACDWSKSKTARTDTEKSGTAVIGCDESFAPIMDEELTVFTGLNIDADITPVYTSEPELFKMLLDDSLRLIMTARDLTENEKEYIKQRKLNPRTQRIAIDAIALIVNTKNTDSLISVQDLKKIMTGEITQWSQITGAQKSKLGDINVVFDNPNSSTLRFIHDSIAKETKLSDKLSALPTNTEVLDYVGNTPNALGIIGVNWVSNPSDSLKLTFRNSIRVMFVSRDAEPTLDNSYQPIPAYLRTGDYALVRNLYLILTDLRGGLPSGFVKFFAGDSGQRIVFKAGLVPATAPTRLINLQTE
ncbi:MAG: substrate-binding domain-containing protein [Prevotellaceae bacterium]|jgi:phosphate transport system substrate-binding protein|nr:substrate-binding domain-containing protein [Prevotellaceae bacterium]